MDWDAQDRAAISAWNIRVARAKHIGMNCALGMVGASFIVFVYLVMHGIALLWLILGPLVVSLFTYIEVGGAMIGFSRSQPEVKRAVERVNRRVRIRQMEQEVAQLDRIIEQAEQT